MYKLGSTWSVVIYHGRDPATGKEPDGYLTALGINRDPADVPDGPLCVDTDVFSLVFTRKQRARVGCHAVLSYERLVPIVHARRHNVVHAGRGRHRTRQQHRARPRADLELCREKASCPTTQ